MFIIIPWSIGCSLVVMFGGKNTIRIAFSLRNKIIRCTGKLSQIEGLSFYR